MACHIHMTLVKDCPKCNEGVKALYGESRLLREVVKGVGLDAEVVTNAKGAKQSATQYRMDLLPPQALLAVAGVLKLGAEKYGDNNWREIPIEDHLNHAIIHAYAYLAGDKQDDHLGHFACRALMALETLLCKGA